jgi:hypothetical protein
MHNLESKGRLNSTKEPQPDTARPIALKNEQIVDSAVYTNTKEILKRAEIIDKLATNQEVNELERQQLTRMLEARSWYEILNLKPGDQVAYFMAPAGDFSVKNLNDNLFGPQLTDLLIKKRNQLLQDLLADNDLASLLNQDFRSAIYKLNQPKMPMAELNRVCAELSQAMKVFLLDKNGLIEQRKQELSQDSNLDAQSLQRKLNDLTDFASKVEKFGFRLSFGLSQVKERVPGKYRQSALAVAEAAQVAQLSRHGLLEKFGLAYDENIILAEVDTINDLREKILRDFPVFTDNKGLKFVVFSQENGIYVFNRDLLRAIRKEELLPDPDQANALGKLQEYVRRINLIDILKPFTLAEINKQQKIQNSRQNIEEFVAEIGRLSEVLTAGQPSEPDKKRLTEILTTDQRDFNCDSAEKFHQKTMQIDDCVYITIDALDVGVELLQEYERLLQEFSRGEKDLAQISLEAGDQMTEYLRIKVRKKALDICHKHFADYQLPNVQLYSLVGGDELILALENQPDIDKLLIRLQKETKGRIVKTVVAQAERHNHKNSSAQDRLGQHLAAIKRSELGTEIAKEVEMKKREISLRLAQKLEEQGKKRNEIKIIIEQGFSDLDLDNYYVKEKSEGRFVIVTSQGYEFRLEETKLKIEQLLVK